MTTKVQAIPLANGQTVITIPGGSDGSQQVTISCVAYPSAGTIALEYQSPGNTSQWFTAYKGAARRFDAQVVYDIKVPVSNYRVTLAAIAGGSGCAFAATDLNGQIPNGAFLGTRALVTQPYTEANVKNGLEFYLRVAYPSTDTIASGATRKIFFRTGSKPVIIKLRDVSFVAEEMIFNLYEAPTTVTGGTAIPIRNYNRVNPVASTATATKDVTTVSDGTLFDGPEYFFGSSSAPQRQAASIPLGRERILPPNTSYIITITNVAGGGTARAQYFLDWYEGDPDLP